MSETYEQTRARHIEAWATRFGDRIERMGWTRDQIDRERTRALRALVAHAQHASPWHRERLAGIDPADLSPADLSRLPTMTKCDLMTHFDDVVTDARVTRAGAEAHLAELSHDAYFLGDLHVVASGGSSGERGVFVYGWDAWIDVHLGLARYVATLFGAPDVPPGPLTMAFVAAQHATHMTAAAGATFRGPNVDTHPFPVTLPVGDIVAGLNRVQPVVLTAYASMLAVLVDEARAGRLRITPRRIVATSEPLLPEVRSAAESEFGAPVANVWGTSEGGVMAVGCWQGTGMHLNEDLVIVEPVDADNNPVAPGETSAKVLLTTLFNPVTPLIRYELTDQVTTLTEPCVCGSVYQRFADIEGRVDDVFTYGDTDVHPHVLRSVLGRRAEVVEYQVFQTATGADVRVRTTDHVDEHELASNLAAALRAAGVPDPAVHVTSVSSLERHAGTGKLRRFVPLPAVA